MAQTNILQPGDEVIASSLDSPSTERAQNAIDGTNTKYLNFDSANNAKPSGFVVTPSAGPTLVTGIAMESANDAPERDPGEITLEGSNDQTISAFDSGNWQMIADLSVGAWTGRYQFQTIYFANTNNYLHYRWTVLQTQSPSSCCMQIAEVQLLGAASLLSQTISFNIPSDLSITNSPITLTASASSGLPVNFVVLSGPATVSGNQLTLTGPGQVVIRALQAGNEQFRAASLDQSFTVTDRGVNLPPVVTTISSSLDTLENSSMTIPYSVSDPDSILDITNVVVSSGSAFVVPNSPANLSVSGAAVAAGTNGTFYVKVTPAPNTGGVAPILFVLSDGYNFVTNTVLLQVLGSGGGPTSLQILTQPANQAVRLGDSATFSVSAQGVEPLKYQWQFQGTNLPGATSFSMTLTNVQLAQAGFYSVLVSDANSSLSSGLAALKIAAIVAWGGNAYGENNIPAGLGTVQAVAGGGNFSLALRDDGTVAAWGIDTYGQTDVPGWLNGVKAIAAGASHCLALKQDGTVVAWGDFSFGGLNVPGNLQNVVSISAGLGHGLALGADGTATQWGYYMWQNPPPVVTNAVAISAGSDHNLAVLTDGTVVAWPLAWYGDRFGETVVPPGLTDVVAVAGGVWHSLALRADGKVVAWGDDSWGQTDVPADLTNVVAIAAGAEHSLALKDDGTLVAWGVKPAGPLPSLLPMVTSIASGWDHALMLLGTGTPVITTQPWDRGVIKGSPVTLAVKAVATPPTSYQWTFNGTPIPGATADRYSVSAVDTSNSGIYRVLVSNSLGMVESRPMSLSLLENAPTNTPCPLVLPTIGDLAINELDSLRVTNTATLCGSPGSRVQYSLAQAPLGAMIDGSGIITWTPAENQGPATNVFLTFAVNYDVQQTTATNSFSVVVNEVNSPPALPRQVDRTIDKLSTLTVVNTASDPDIPANTLNYQLIDAPVGASIDGNGLIQWTPTDAQAPSTNLITTVVTDSGSPPLSATNQFQVVVLDSTNGVPVGVIAGPIVNPANGHEYFLLEPATWTNAEQAAVGLGGHLVTMNTDEENTWVYDTFGKLAGLEGDVWIGLYDPDPANRSGIPLQQRAQYRWISGQPAAVNLNQWALYDESYRADYKSTGFYKLCGPNNPNYNYPGHWKDDFESTPLNSVVERPVTLELVSQPSRISAGIGSPVTLSMCFDGPLPISYQWQRAGVDLVGETRSTLTLTNVHPDQSDDYSLSATGGRNSLVSGPITLSVAGVVAWGGFAGADARTNVPSDLTSVLAVAAGYYHDLALKADGTVVAWGDNSQNQLAVPAGLSNVVAISGGRFHSLALKGDGTVVAWGDPTESAIQVPPDLANVVAIDAGGSHSLALKADGTVVAWGWGCWAPATVPPGLSNVVAISAGDCHDVALKADGTVVDWYNNNNAPANLDAITSGLTNIAAVSAGEPTSLALRTDGTIAAWGISGDWPGVRNIPSGLANVAAVSVKSGRPLALRADGTVVAWGTNAFGEATIPTGLPNVVAIAQGIGHSLVLLRDGSPTMTVQPWDRVVPTGASPSFAAKVVGIQSMNYQWQFNGTDIAGATHDTLSIPNAALSDSGVYSLAVSNEVGIVASRQAKLIVSTGAPGPGSHAPLLPDQPAFVVDELASLIVINTATDPDNSGISLTYQLIDRPAGATIDASGIIHWTPTEEQGPGTALITTVATKGADPTLTATNRFSVVVNEVNSAPVLPVQADLTISALSQLVVMNQATDPDIPANTLTYQLVNPPAGATIDANGVIRWTPTRAQGPSTNTLITVVTDNGVPSLSVANSFTVRVSAPTLVPVQNFTLSPGQLLSFTNFASDNDPSRQLTFSFVSAPSGASLTSDTGIFSWRPPVAFAGTSNYVQIRVTDDSPTPVSVSSGFGIRVTSLASAVLEPAFLTNGTFRVRVTGALGPDYILQSSQNAFDWISLQTNTPVTMPLDFIDLKSPTNRFYRIRLGP